MEKTLNLRRSIFLIVAAGSLISSVSAQNRRPSTAPPTADTTKPRTATLPLLPPNQALNPTKKSLRIRPFPVKVCSPFIK